MMSQNPKNMSQAEFDPSLIAQVHPDNWTNPTPASKYNLVIVGGGTAGLVTSAIAAGLGARVALIEKRFLGGDCLNFGCVPSKALIKSADMCFKVSESSRFGASIEHPIGINFKTVMDRVRNVRTQISKNDSAERFTRLGVDVFFGEASFTGPDRVEVKNAILNFKKAVIATGSRPKVPDISGLTQAGFFTNENIFEIKNLPRRLAVLGGGPIGCELAQAFKRLGSQVILFHKNNHILDREDPEAADILQNRFLTEGIDLRLSTSLINVSLNPHCKKIEFIQDGQQKSVDVDEILVATGRSPNVDGIGLENARIEYDTIKGVFVNDYLQTTNPDIFSAGDVCMRHKFTHAADAAARIVVENALFRKSGTVSALVIPWCTYTDPEIARVGIDESEAERQGIPYQVFRVDMRDVDRAVTDGVETGFAKIITKANTDKILGATVVGHCAGELVGEITLAIKANIGMKTISSTIHPYPTKSLIIKRLADMYMGSRMTPNLKKLTRAWFWFRRIF